MGELERRRIANITGTERCDWCDRGLALVAYRPQGAGEMAEYGPCPWCEQGLRLEFPTGKKGPKGEPGAKPSWGPEGYWRGRTPVVERRPPEGRPLPIKENALRARLLALRFGGNTAADPTLALDEADPAARMAALCAHLATFAA